MQVEKVKRLLLVDGTNILIANYCSNPTISSSGQHIGGTAGFLRSISKQIRLLEPDQIIVCWDGPGGSAKRRAINSSYKDGRKPVRLNRQFDITVSEQQEQENRQWQQKRLIEYLDHLPIMQLAISGVEADDLISFLVKSPQYQGWFKFIASNDKDFFQLCDKWTLVYRPSKEQTLNRNDIINEYGIHPTNFALARSISGDNSDNLCGVGGIGLPTVAKRFPLLKEQKDVTIEQMVTYSQEQIENKSKIAAYRTVVNNKNIISKNYSIMQLYAPMIGIQDTQRLNNAINDFEPSHNQTALNMMMMQDGIISFDWSGLHVWSNRVVKDFKQKGEKEGV